MQTEERRLDGNAAAGALRELFARGVTGALATCGACRQTRPLGELLEYGHAMGVVLRCPACNMAMVRLVQARDWLRVDLSGMALLAIT